MACEINSKWGVSPVITTPKAIKPSYFFIFFDITTGISNTPGTLIILYFILDSDEVAYNSKELDNSS